MKASIHRKTKETDIKLDLSLEDGKIAIATPDLFLNHMLGTLAKHGRLGLLVKVVSKDKDPHHFTEDVAISLGQALRSVTTGRPIARFAHEVIAMDDALVTAVLDVGGRAYYEGRLPEPMWEHFFRSLAHEAGITLHLAVARGRDPHHVVEAAFKAFARALHAATRPAAAIASTKGEVDTRGR